MDQQYKNLTKTIDGSGFPLQIALEHEVKRGIGSHKWKVLAHEHPWSNAIEKEEGFIDIILGHYEKRILIECKLRKDDNWIFLIPLNAEPSQEGRFYLSHISPAGYLQVKCVNETLSHPMQESEFCVVRKGAGEKLEDIASKLVLATEGLIQEESQINKLINDRDRYLYYPAIVTAAKLFVCRYDPDKISLNDGSMDEGTSQIETIPFIKFTKSLTINLTQDANPRTIVDANMNKRRTVFIINSNHISEFLKKI